MDGTNRMMMDFEADPNMAFLPLENADTQTFDYTAYMQQQDIDYFAEESSSTSTTTQPLSTSPATIQTLSPSQQHFGIPVTSAPMSLSSSSPRGQSATAVILHHQIQSPSHIINSPSPPNPPPNNRTKQRLERRGHTKSRRGCFNCKRRRIKCQETKPSCGHCIKTGLSCSYPSPPSSSSPQSSSSSSANHPSTSAASLVRQPGSQPFESESSFTLLDFRLFHHFLSTCYPHHPIGSESLWTHEVPCLSQTHPFLMHAILGYAASDLADSLSSSPSFSSSSSSSSALLPPPPSASSGGSSNNNSDKNNNNNNNTAQAEMNSKRRAELLTAAMGHRLKAIKAIKKSLEESAQQGQQNRQQNQSSSSSSSVSGKTRDDGKFVRESRTGTGTGEEGTAAGAGEGGTGPMRRVKDIEEEGNALMATCFALTYQSVLLDDGMVEYMTFIRGILIVAVQMFIVNNMNYYKNLAAGGARKEGGGCEEVGGGGGGGGGGVDGGEAGGEWVGLARKRMLFGELLADQERDKRLEPHMSVLGLIKREWVDAAMVAVDGLEPLLVEREGEVSVEKEYWFLLKKMAGLLYVSSWKAYQAMAEHYGWWMMLSHEKFQRLIEPGNQTAVLLATHWIALKQIMAVITETEEKAAVMCPEDKGKNKKAGNDISLGIIRWLKYLNRLVDEEHLTYNRWPMWVEAQLEIDRGYFGKTH